MKLFFLIFALLFGTAISIFAQQKAAETLTREELLSKSKKQKTTGFILLGAGAAATASGAAIISNNFCIFGCSQSEDRALGVGSGLFVAGGIAMLASIPMFIGATQKSKRAYQISAANERILLPDLGQPGPKSYPALKLKVFLNR